MDICPLTVVGPEGFVLAGAVVFDDSVGGIQDVLGGAVILLEADYHSVGIDFFKVQDIADVGAAEFIDGLIVISHNTEIFVSAGKKADQLKLGAVGILVFVDHDIAEAPLVHLQHFIVGVKKLHGQHQQIVEIQSVIFAKKPLVLLVGHADLLFAEADAVVFLAVFERGQELIFGSRNIGEDFPLPQVFGVDAEGLADFLHQGFLIVRVINGKGGLVAHEVDVTAEDPDAHGVEG